MEYRFKTNDKIKNYEVLKPIGKGSYGQVYLVKWTTSEGEKQGALKILEENAKLSSIINEVFNWGKLTNHSNILTFIHPDTCNGQVLLVSEYVEDGSLEDWFENNHQKPKFVNETVELMFGALNGLEHLHINKVLHRDIKPSNILLNGKNPLLADFGLAIDLEIEQSSNIGGTLRYLSPKLMNVHLNLGVKKVSYKRTVQDDLWAICLTFYELLTGEIPFSFSDEIRDCAPNKFSLKLPKDFHSFFRKAFSKNESDRFQTVSQMKSALKICWEKVQAKETLQTKETIEDKSWIGRENRNRKIIPVKRQQEQRKDRNFTWEAKKYNNSKWRFLSSEAIENIGGIIVGIIFMFLIYIGLQWLDPKISDFFQSFSNANMATNSNSANVSATNTKFSNELATNVKVANVSNQNVVRNPSTTDAKVSEKIVVNPTLESKPLPTDRPSNMSSKTVTPTPTPKGNRNSNRPVNLDNLFENRNSQ